METIFPTTAGWVTNRRSGCVQLAFEWAILRMTESGDIGRWRNAWLTETACSATTELATGQSGRRLGLTQQAHSKQTFVLSQQRLSLQAR